MAILRTPIVLALATLMVAGCATNEKKTDYKVPSGDLDYKPAPVTPKPAGLDVKSRMPKFALPATVADTKLYSFRATGQPVRLALSQLATAYKLNIAVDQDVDGIVTVDLKQLPLEQVLEALLEPLGLAWQWQDGLLRVSKLETRTFTIDYLRLVRSGAGSSSTSTSMASSGGGGGGGGGSDGTSTSTIGQSDTINFWDELEEQLENILERTDEDYTGGERPMETTVQTDRATNITTTLTKPVRESAGRLVIDRTSGTIQVTTSRARMKNVVEFISRVEKGIKRQVYIEAKVVEVALSDDQAFGVDWNKIGIGNSTELGSDVTISTPADGPTGLQATFTGTYVRQFSAFGSTLDVAAAVQALSEQGNVKVVSQPRIRTLNNQAAIVRVGTERTFFVKNVNERDTDGVTRVEISYEANTITEGLVLTVTPQISEDGRVTMDVNPVLTRITGVDTSPDGGATAPRLDIKQTSTLVRMHDGETIVVGGLIQETVSDTDRAVPIVGEVPGLGQLFSASYDRDARKELVVFLTPRIIE